MWNPPLIKQKNLQKQNQNQNQNQGVDQPDEEMYEYNNNIPNNGLHGSAAKRPREEEEDSTEDNPNDPSGHDRDELIGHAEPAPGHAEATRSDFNVVTQSHNKPSKPKKRVEKNVKRVKVSQTDAGSEILSQPRGIGEQQTEMRDRKRVTDLGGENLRFQFESELILQAEEKRRSPNMEVSSSLARVIYIYVKVSEYVSISSYLVTLVTLISLGGVSIGMFGVFRLENTVFL